MTGHALLGDPEQSGAPVAASDSAQTRPVVRAIDLQKHFRRADGSTVRAIDHVSLEVEAGELVVLLGPSGCGKTTLLRAVGGLERPDAGDIEVAGRIVFSGERRTFVPPEKRNISMVFQSYALWPHMTALQNVTYPLRARHMPKQQACTVGRRVLELVGIEALAGQHPSQMSGGQQQRVALARAIVGNSEIILFDEPLSNVDAKVREQLRIELLSMQREFNFAGLYVTHDQAEAMELGSRIVVMRDGKVEQIGRPRYVYDRPATRFVANFVGRMNELPATVVSKDATAIRLSSPMGDVTVPALGEDFSVGAAVVLGVRPERGRLSRAQPATPSCRAVVEFSLFAGAVVEYLVRVGDHQMQVSVHDDEEFAVGDEAWFGVTPQDFRIFSPES